MNKKARSTALDRLPSSHAGGDVGLTAALALINSVGSDAPPADLLNAIAAVLAVDPPSAARLRRGHLPAFVVLATQLRQIATQLHHHDVDGAARGVNELLAQHPALTHLAKDEGQWCLHHHPADADLVGMWSAITADALARLIGERRADRVGICGAGDCAAAFVDRSKNGSRRFCSTRCQNRVKAASFRRRAG